MKIGIIGCGNMGRALLRGILAKHYTNRRNVLCSDRDRERLRLVRSRFRVCTTSSNSELFKKCNVIIFAIKPQDVDKVVQDAQLPLVGKVLISVCAGVSTQRLQKDLGKVSIVRAMPNMPAQISQGISALSLGRYATAKDKRVAVSIFSCIGEVVEVKERLLDAVTAISGSGPAYFFYLTERLIDVAEKLGISSKIARRLALKTALGSAMLMEQSKKDPQILRKQVSSKGGTTEAAFTVFKKKNLDKILTQALKAASKRAKKLRE